ncbi:hypothetical protein SCUCBS95973_007150 [Sporothrix curviconia]|uniref:Transcription factor domain-containing protein n=1 Tax=Sporothrix curviconia TaxID=1260050 RepID=A0ABP0CB03_9PEZI
MAGPSRSQQPSTELEYLQRRVLELESQTRRMSAENGMGDERMQSLTQDTPVGPRIPRQEGQQNTTAVATEDEDDSSSMEGEDGDAHEPDINSNNKDHRDTNSDNNGPRDRRDTSDTVIKDAASILEFLAWGRRKDPKHHPTTAGRRNSSSVADSDASVGDGRTTAAASTADTLTAAMPMLLEEDEPAASGDVHPLTWPARNGAPFISGGSINGRCGPPGSGSSGYDEPFGDGSAQHPLAVMQLLLPSRKLVEQLVDYHIDCLLWYHASFLAPSFRADLADFYDRHGGSVEYASSASRTTSPVDLQWVALLFAVLAGSLTTAPAPQALAWGFREPERHTLCKHWFQAALACLSRDQYMANHSIYACQAIATMTISAHILGFSNTQSIQLAAAVRIAQSLGLHRLGEDAGRQGGRAALAEAEMGRRVWNQLCSQDWFGIPFSESYLVNPLHSQTSKPANCHDEDIEAAGAASSFPASLPESEPTVSGYCRFLHTIASIMPRLQDGLLACNTAYTRYQQVLSWDAHMRTLATADRPIFLTSQVPLQPHWPVWIPWARRALAISSGHKIIMIHRSCLSKSFTSPAFAFTRHTCIAASKTIIKEYKAVACEEGPVLWVHQAFSVAASIILILDVLHRQPGEEQQHAEHEGLVQDVVSILQQYPHSMIAVRGIKLLCALLDEVGERSATTANSAAAVDASAGTTRKRKRHETVPPAETRSLDTDDGCPLPSSSTRQRNGFNVPAFIRNYCHGKRWDSTNNGFENLLYLANHDFSLL